MYNYKIQKVVDEEIDADEVDERINEIALEFDIKVYTLTNNSIAWEANGVMQNHNAICLEFSQIDKCKDIRVICYLLNKAFEGAPVFLMQNNNSEQIIAGHTPFKPRNKRR